MIINQYDESLEKASKFLDELKKLQAAGLICWDGDFVPSVHYPPITRYPPITGEDLFQSYVKPQDGLFDVYVHIPFCKQRCTFCHYPGKLGSQDEEIDRYLTALEKEMDIYMHVLGIDKIKARSILLGGGTPTFLSPGQLDHFLSFFVKRVDLSQCRQFNVDTDPGSLVGAMGEERLKLMREYQINRLTIGTQSFNDQVLKEMNRPHDARTAIESVYKSKEHGYQLNIEFIYGYPGETVENWIEVMEKAVSLPVEEIQLYRLKVLAYGDHQGHILNEREKNPLRIPSFDETMIMKHVAVDILGEHGYHENLRRVYSKERKHFSHYAHNQCCMLYDQIGFGLTAFSSLRDRFALNTQYFTEYYSSIDEGRLPVNRGTIRSREQQLRWALILPLKNRNVRRAYFEKITGTPLSAVFVKKIERLKQYGLLQEDQSGIQLTELGAMVADEVVEQFNSNEFMPFPREAYAEGPLNPYFDNTGEDAFGFTEADNLRDGMNSSRKNTFINIPNNDSIQTSTIQKPDLKQVLQENNWNVHALDDQQLNELLECTGEFQAQLFEKARNVRRQVHGDAIHLRGVIEYSNICQKDCDYCAMRCSNQSLDRYQMDPEMILSIAKQISEAGIGTIFLQAGQNPKSDKLLDDIIPTLRKEFGAEVLLCIGERNLDTYRHFADLGCNSFILKFETSDEEDYRKLAHTSLKNRLQSMYWIREAGIRVGTGNILGLPGQNRKNILSDLRYAFSVNPDFISTSPFIPNKGTPLQDHPYGDIQLSLNMMAILRLGVPTALIPAVSALEVISPNGQLMGLNAGANVLTINFTPKSFREQYQIYSKDRFIVGLKHACNTARLAGLELKGYIRYPDTPASIGVG